MSQAKREYPAAIAIQPLTRLPAAQICVPGSKSITNRALVLAALQSYEHNCVLRGALCSEDTQVMVDGLRALGFLIDAQWPSVHISRHEGKHLVPTSAADIFVANSGTTMRFLTALCALGHGRYRLDGIPRMRERPMKDLLAALRSLGVRAFSETGNGCPPIVVDSDGSLKGPGTRIRGDVSSQFLSALLMVAIFSNPGPVCLLVEGPLVSKPYVAMTLSMMNRWGATWRQAENGYIFNAESSANFGSISEYDIEPDASAASYFFAASAITGGRVALLELPEHSLQGDTRFVEVLAEMGCRVEKCSAGITVHGRPLRGISADMNDISDCVMSLAAVACFADGPTTIRNVAHIRHKETDRLAALATELRRVGAAVEEFVDGLRITPRPLHGAAIETYDDHRMAMSMALLGLKIPGIIISKPGCVAKTYPNFFDDLERLRR
jgi:3-phosphoshikimate 1-carboxyvinyltransferase